MNQFQLTNLSCHRHPGLGLVRSLRTVWGEDNQADKEAGPYNGIKSWPFTSHIVANRGTFFKKRFHQGETASAEPGYEHQSSCDSSASLRYAINGAGLSRLRPTLKSVFPLEAEELVGRRW